MASTVGSQARIGNWRYAFWRPQDVQYTAQQIVTETIDSDCSSGCRILCHAASAPDPAGNGYASWGNSSTIWARCEHITLSEAQPGDMATFGYSTGEHHVCMLWEPAGNGDWWVWNHGRPGDPHKGLLSQEREGHAGMTVTIVSLGVPDPPPTPEDKLREKTGFYSWVAWKLGEGPWRKYGKASPKVRPHVPRVIPVKWWRQYAAFLRARKKPNK